MKLRKSLISLFMCAVMVISMMPAISVSAAKSPKDIDKVIIDLRSEEAFENTGGKIYIHNNGATEKDLYHGGKQSFDAEKKAIKLEYYPDTTGRNKNNPYRLMCYLNKTKAITEAHKFVALVYQAKTSSTYDLSLWNTPGTGTNNVYVTGGGDTAGKWVVTEAKDISGENNGSSVLARFVNNNANNCFYVKSDDPNMEFYIKEIGFFTSAEDAKEYYSQIDLEKDPKTYMSAEQIKRNYLVTTGSDGLPLTNKGEGLVTVTHKEYTLTDHGLAEEIEDEEFVGELPAPVIMNFASLVDLSNCGAYQTDHSGNTEGSFNYVKLDDGTKCIRLNYSVPDTGNWARYRMMPAFYKAGTVTAQHKYMRITYMTPDPISSTITVTNNVQTATPVTLVEDTSTSKGEWMVSNAVNINSAGILQRYMDGKHCTIGFTAVTDSSVMYIKEVAFFATKQQAYEYYGDGEVDLGSGMTAITFGTACTGTTVDNEGYGKYVKNADKGTIDISYAEKTNHGVNYMVQIKYVSKDYADKTHRYVRVLYSAKNPEGVNENVAMYLRNNGDASDIIRLQKNVKDTNGEYVLSETALLSPSLLERFTTKNIHNSIWFNTTAAGGEYSIKAVYFFPSKKAADNFDPNATSTVIDINGNDISKYQIVIPEDKPYQLLNAAEDIVNHVESVTGIELPIVTDADPATDYEIVLGSGSRAESVEAIKAVDHSDAFKYYAEIIGDKIVIVSASHFAVADGVDTLLDSFLARGKTMVPPTITINEKFNHTGRSAEMKAAAFWEPIENVSDPDIFTDDFASDDGYWLEENAADNWSIANGTLSVTAKERDLTYIHVYEANAEITAKLSYKKAGANGKFGLMLRYTAPDAHVTAGYDFKAGEWYIEYREGNDFPAIRLASVKATLKEGTVYTLAFTADKDSAVLEVDGKEILAASGITHVTPGRIAIFATDVTLTADDAEIILLSGLGTIMRNVVHNRLPDEYYREGGTVVEMTDGTLIYQHAMTAAFKSTDGGYTWTRLDELYFNTDSTYPQVLRLNNGDLLQIRFGSSNGAKRRYAMISKDDGKTWTKGGDINTATYNGSKANNLNMNDKITQISSGRIFYVQNYNAGNKANNYLGKYQVFDAVFYSDDNGMTWHESETATFEIEGNTEEEYFAESKVVECADGTLRLYNSWNLYGCIVYSESTDNGVTWGEIKTLPEFPCARSSMQLIRDLYGETDTTYYMVWVNTDTVEIKDAMPRARLSLAKTTDGKTWDFLGDLWHWQHNYTHEGALLAHIVDPFVKCTEDAVIIGTGLAEYLPVNGDSSAAFHGAQRQHIWTITRETVDETAKPMNGFVDVSVGAPYYSAVSFVAAEGLFNGVSATEFAPDTVMNRSMFVTVLGRLDKADVSKYTTPTFSDVVAGQWYTSYVEWAAANGIVNGMGNGVYGINGSITVEQACTILFRYNGGKTSDKLESTKLADYSDASKVSSWAKEGVEWALANGIYDGKLGKLEPSSAASRADVAMMFANYVKAFG